MPESLVNSEVVDAGHPAADVDMIFYIGGPSVENDFFTNRWLGPGYPLQVRPRVQC